MTKTLFAAAAALAVLSGAAYAQPSDSAAPAAPMQIPPASQIIAAWDSDHDNAVSQAEWVAAGRPEQAFGMVDTNSDGKINEAELQAAINAMRAQQQQQAAPAAPAQGQ